MVKEVEFNEKTAFQCEKCGMKYWERDLAGKCQTFCEKHPNLCDPEISEKAIKE